MRNNIKVDKLDPLTSVSVGNGGFAFTVDATGLQTFPNLYDFGVPLGTYSEWGWNSFANPKNLRHDETLVPYDFRDRPELYATIDRSNPRNVEAYEWYRINPHRMHLGFFGLELTDVSGNPAAPDALTGISQTTDLWNGVVNSAFTFNGSHVEVQTVCCPVADMVGTKVKGAKLNLRFAYPSGGHSDNATDWNQPDKHSTAIVEKGDGFVVLERKLGQTIYYVKVQWTGAAVITEKYKHYFVLTPASNEVSVSCLYSQDRPDGTQLPVFDNVAKAAAIYWNDFWQSGGAVDFSQCTDPRASELERRVVLSQYLTRLQNAQSVPPAESGLTYNTWYGRPHLEMHWWHGTHFPLWERADLLERSLSWYENVAFAHSKEIAERQGFDGVRWMKMTDNLANEAPSNIGSFLIWQQPHIIYFAELMYRHNPSLEVLEKYKHVVMETAKFMASFPTYEEMEIRYILQGYIPAQETLRATEVINSPFELSYWHYALGVAQEWHVRLNMGREPGMILLINSPCWRYRTANT